jgi:DNA-binding XRE family transcriptional regulator
MLKYDKLKMVDDLKQMRLDSGLSQKALGEQIGISRETVLAIEKKHTGAMNTLEMDVVKLWFRTCKSTATAPLLARFKKGITAFFGV